MRPKLFRATAIVRRAEITPGTLFVFDGRPLKVIASHGTDPAAPVIVEELSSFGETSLSGQLSLWSFDAVSRLLWRPPGAR